MSHTCVIMSCVDTNIWLLVDYLSTYSTVMSTILRIYTHDRVWLYRIEPLLDVNVPVDKNAIVSTKLIAIDCNRISTVDCYLFFTTSFCSAPRRPCSRRINFGVSLCYGRPHRGPRLFLFWFTIVVICFFVLSYVQCHHQIWQWQPSVVTIMAVLTAVCGSLCHSHCLRPTSPF